MHTYTVFIMDDALDETRAYVVVAEDLEQASLAGLDAHFKIEDLNRWDEHADLASIHIVGITRGETELAVSRIMTADEIYERYPR